MPRYPQYREAGNGRPVPSTTEAGAAVLARTPRGLYGLAMTNPEHGYTSSAPQEETVLAILAHVSIFAFGLIGPLVLFLVVKDDPTKTFTRHHALEALNFHITLAIAGVVSAILVIVLIGFLMLLAVYVAGVVLGIMAAVAASRHELYRYPFTLRLVH